MKTLMKINNGRNFVFPQFQSLFDDFLIRDFAESKNKDFGTLPAVNVKETDTAYELELAAPGMDKKDFKIELENDALTISAHIENKSEEKDNGYTRREFSYRSFKRIFSLPENGVNSEQVSANYKDGVLHILVPKKEQEKIKAVKAIQVD